MQAKGLILLMRPLNAIVASLAVLLAAFMTHEMNYKVIFAIASVIFISAGGNSINDYFDYEIDKINKPKRPLPANLISLREAYHFSIFMFAIGVFIAFFINIACFIIAIGSSMLLYYYAKVLKNAGFPGNLSIAGLTSMAIIYGGLSVAGIDEIIFVALFAFLINLGREIIKDVEDYKGDMACGAHTLAINLGIQRALLIGIIPLVAIMISTPMPFILGMYNKYYMIIMAIGVDMPLIFCITKIVSSPTSKTAEEVKKILKIIIILGILGLYIGS